MSAAVNLLWVGLWVAACGFTILRGRGVARVVGLAFLLDEIVVLAFPQTQPVKTVRISYLAGDAAVTLVLVWATFRSPRRWPTFALGFQAVSVVTQLAKLTDMSLGPWAYYTASYLWGFAALGALTLGVARDPGPRRAGRHRGDRPAA